MNIASSFIAKLSGIGAAIIIGALGGGGAMLLGERDLAILKKKIDLREKEYQKKPRNNLLSKIYLIGAPLLFEA